MDAAESGRLYQQADQLFQAGRFEQALGLLDQLNRAFPNTRDILYPAALCLERLGRTRDAIVLCNQLIAQFEDPRAHDLKRRLTSPVASVPHDGVSGYDQVESTALADLGLSGASDILDFEPRRVPQPVHQDSGSDWKKYTLIGLGVAVLVALLIVPPLMYDVPSTIPAGNGQGITQSQFANRIGVGMYIVLTVIMSVGYGAGGYVALKIMDKLPSDEFLANCFSLGTTMIIMTLLGFIPIVGPIISLVIISKTYDLGCGGLIMFCFIGAIGTLIVGIVPIMLLISSMGGMVPAQ